MIVPWCRQDSHQKQPCSFFPGSNRLRVPRLLLALSYDVWKISKIKMMSVYQIAVYHILLEAYNVMRHSSSEQTHKKWTNIGGKKYSLRNITNNDLKVPEKPKLKCLGFTYSRAKLFNMLPLQMREPKKPSKLCQKIGCGKTSLHINQFCLFLSFNKSVKIL